MELQFLTTMVSCLNNATNLDLKGDWLLSMDIKASVESKARTLSQAVQWILATKNILKKVNMSGIDQAKFNFRI